MLSISLFLSVSHHYCYELGFLSAEQIVAIVSINYLLTNESIDDESAKWTLKCLNGFSIDHKYTGNEERAQENRVKRKWEIKIILKHTDSWSCGTETNKLYSSIHENSSKMPFVAELFSFSRTLFSVYTFHSVSFGLRCGSRAAPKMEMEGNAAEVPKEFAVN